LLLKTAALLHTFVTFHYLQVHRCLLIAHGCSLGEGFFGSVSAVSAVVDYSLQVECPGVVVVLFQLGYESAIVGVGVVDKLIDNPVQRDGCAVGEFAVVNACAACHTLLGEHPLCQLTVECAVSVSLERGFSLTRVRFFLQSYYKAVGVAVVDAPDIGIDYTPVGTSWSVVYSNIRSIDNGRLWCLRMWSRMAVARARPSCSLSPPSGEV